MTCKGPAATTVFGCAAIAVAAALLLSGCTTIDGFRSGGDRDAEVADEGPSAVDSARDALAAEDLQTAESVLAVALAPIPGDDATAGPTIRGTADTADLLVLRAELRIRQRRYLEAESDALTAMALVPATLSAEDPMPAFSDEPYGPRDYREGSEDAEPAPAAEPPRLTQRSIHIRLAHLYEDRGEDDTAERHLDDAHELCIEDPVHVERRDCELERRALVRIRLARGRYAEAEPLVLEEIADVQSRYGPDDLRLSFALCNVARFYARQGKYALSGPLFARSLDLWKSVQEDAAAEQARAVAAGEPGPFDAAFLRPRAGHAPFAAPCGLEDQPLLLYKLGKPKAAADAIGYEQELWEADRDAGAAAIAYLAALEAQAAAPLDLASARHAVAFIALRKGDQVRAEEELREVVAAYAAEWPTLAISDRRYHVEDYLKACESLIELWRETQRHAEAYELGLKARDIAAADVDGYDSLRLDTQLSLAKTFREMRTPVRAERAAGLYLDAIVDARGDRSPDYAWALRTISYAYLLRGELDASKRMEMQAKAIWAKHDIVAPEF